MILKDLIDIKKDMALCDILKLRNEDLSKITPVFTTPLFTPL